MFVIKLSELRYIHQYHQFRRHATYVTSLPLNTVLIGVTADEAEQSLNQNAKNALLALGVNVNALQPWGKLSFITQVIQPAMAVSAVAPSDGINLKMTVNVKGKLIVEYYYACPEFLLNRATKPCPDS